MRRTRQILTGVLGALGLALVLYGVSGGLWPLSVQLVTGLLLLVYAVVRWRVL
jgi:hypothetical protein